MARKIPAWWSWFLQLTAIYYLLCALSAAFFYRSWFWAAGIAPVDHTQSALLLAVISSPMFALFVAALIASSAPVTHWALLIVLFVHNLTDGIVNVIAGLNGTLPAPNAAAFVGLDAVLCVGIAIILAGANRSIALRQEMSGDLEGALEMKPESIDRSLRSLSFETKLLLVFIRHSGCTFCREHLAKLQEERKRLDGNSFRIVVVGMSEGATIRQLADRFGLNDALVVSDPDRKLYRALEIRRGSFWQVLGPSSMWHAIAGGTLFRYGQGEIDADPFQLPGTAVLQDGKVIASRSAETASEYCEITPLLGQPSRS